MKNIQILNIYNRFVNAKVCFYKILKQKEYNFNYFKRKLKEFLKGMNFDLKTFRLNYLEIYNKYKEDLFHITYDIHDEINQKYKLRKLFFKIICSDIIGFDERDIKEMLNEHF